MLSKNNVKCFQRGIVEVCGNVTIGAAGAVDVTTGTGFSIAHTTTGVYTITLDDQYQAFIAGNCNVQFYTTTSTNFDLTAQFGLYVAADRTLVIRIWDHSGAALADPADDDSIHFNLKLQWTSV